jgi:hypothetical protein
MCKTDVYFFEDEMDSGFRNLAQSSAIFLYTALSGGGVTTIRGRGDDHSE